VQKHGKDEIVLNKSYQELAEHYRTAILPARVRASKDKPLFGGTVVYHLYIHSGGSAACHNWFQEILNSYG